jgi:hypothetical protein
MKLDYGQLLRRAWDLIWQHKFLILLGVLVALSGVGNASGSGYRADRQDFNFDWQGPRDFRDWPQMPEAPQIPELPNLPRNLGLPVAVGTVLLLIIAGLAVIFGIALWVVSTLARGGLIAGVNTLEGGGTSIFGAAFGAGWQNGWRLLGIGLLPAIPGLILLIAGLGISGALVAVSQLAGIRTLPVGVGIISILGALACIALPFALILGLIRNFAERACMLEDLGVFAAYKRGWKVLTANLGEAVVLFLIQIGISIAVGLLMAMPGVLMALCCVLWPVLLVIRGAIAAYFSTLWTLAWREWTLPISEATA